MKKYALPLLGSLLVYALSVQPAHAAGGADSCFRNEPVTAQAGDGGLPCDAHSRGRIENVFYLDALGKCLDKGGIPGAISSPDDPNKVCIWREVELNGTKICTYKCNMTFDCWVPCGTKR